MFFLMWKVSDKVHISQFPTREHAAELKRIVEETGGVAIMEDEIPQAWKEGMDPFDCPDDPIRRGED